MAITQLGKANWQVGITDNVSRAVRQIRSNIEEGIGQAVRRFTDRIQGGLDAVGRRLQRLGAQFTSFGAKLGGIGLAIASPIFLSVRSFATLDDQLRLLSGITGALPRQFASVSARIRELGRTTSFTAAEVAAGAVALGRAGFDTTEIETSIGSILNLSRATGTELAESADIAGNTLRGFGLDVSKTGQVVDVLTATANGSAQTLTDLFEGMKLVAPIANQVGAKVRETAASLGILANIGIKGSMAGTSLRQVFLQLAKTDTQETLKGIGVAVTDATGEMRPLNDILSDIVKQSGSLSKVKRLDLFADLFDSRAAGAAAAVGASTEAVESFRKKLAEANGVAARTAAQMDAGVGGSFRRFLSAIEGISHAIGSSLEPSLKDLTDKFSDVAGRVTEFIGRNQGLVATIAAVVAGMIAAGAAITGVGLSLTVVGVGLRGVASSLGLITGPLNLAITGFRLLTTAAALSATNIVGVFRVMGAALLPIFAKIGLALAISLKSAASGVAAALLPIFGPSGIIVGRGRVLRSRRGWRF
ncbi:phage tail tape measure protein [Fuerstiella marisgermanici]|uniref:Phage tail tape measure protein, TP901 family, core region n=1 Tax=Fuerstiella marisgermanici TaxID=1891926 RepID=A0A1P8WB67_9PLAN|nr:phage tail tape measure protein [Fuerstiella marisgermanici]APZ91302.1 phage tail tape measure protein, TP901 family, core region [Fuerstiella marisgermanici]